MDKEFGNLLKKVLFTFFFTQSHHRHGRTCYDYPFLKISADNKDSFEPKGIEMGHQNRSDDDDLEAGYSFVKSQLFWRMVLRYV